MPYDIETDDIDLHITAAWVNVPSAFASNGGELRGSGLHKTIATAGNTAAGVGITAAQFGTGTSSLAVAGAITAGAAVSATGVGLVVVGGVLTLSSMATNAASMVSSAAIVTGLKKILANPGKFAGCTCPEHSLMTPDATRDHDWIQNKVLPYIIAQKTEKAVKKGVGILPGMGLATNAYRLGRYLFKKDRGKKRGFYAFVLTRHLITHDCALAGAIVAELFSVKEMLVLRTFDSDLVEPIIASKMKSV
jgi:hypothetical protein